VIALKTVDASHKCYQLTDYYGIEKIPASRIAREKRAGHAAVADQITAYSQLTMTWWCALLLRVVAWAMAWPRILFPSHDRGRCALH
jgi:hypothetical protein